MASFFDRFREAEPVKAQRVAEALNEYRLVKAKLTADLQQKVLPIPASLPSLPPEDNYAQMGRATKTRVAVELPNLDTGEWGNVKSVLAALAQHDKGYFRTSGLLYQAMMMDPAIRGPLDVRAKALTGLEIKFNSINDSPDAKDCADDAQQHFRTWISAEEQERFFRTRLMMGASAAQPIWTYEGTGTSKREMPTVNCWEPQWMYYIWDGQSRNFGHWVMITSTDVEETMDGDARWIFARNTLKDPQYTGLIRSLGLRYVARLQSLAGLGKYQQRFALAILKLKQPATFDEKDSSTLQGQLQAGTSPLVTLPQGDTEFSSWDLEWEYIQGSQGYDVFLRTLSELKAEMALDILGQTLTSDTGTSGGGAKALGEVHDNVRMDLRKSDAIQDQGIWRSGLLKPYAAKNYRDPEVAPMMAYVVDSGPSADQKATALKDLTTFLQAVKLPPKTLNALLIEFGIEVDPTESGSIEMNTPEPAPEEGAPEKKPVKSKLTKVVAKDDDIIDADSDDDDDDDAFSEAEEQPDLDKVTHKSRRALALAIDAWLLLLNDKLEDVETWQEVQDAILETIPEVDGTAAENILRKMIVGSWEAGGGSGVPRWAEEVAEKLSLSTQLDVFSKLARDAEEAQTSGQSVEEALPDVLGDTNHATQAEGQITSGVVDTAAQTTFEQGRDAAHDPDDFPLARYRAAVLDKSAKVCPICMALHGTIRRTDDEWWKTHWPGAMHVACRCWKEFLTHQEIADKHLAVFAPEPTRNPDAQPSAGWGTKRGLRDYDPYLNRPDAIVRAFKESLKDKE